MFDIIPDTLSNITTILFPIFASYKALRTNDPTTLQPWLMYWVVLSLFNVLESYLWLLTWLPFYAWFRFFIHLYLVMPGQSGGATFLYTEYVHPFLAKHESEIERYISEFHESAKKAGLEYAKLAVEWVKVNVLGFPPRQPTPPPSRGQSYAQNLLSRFNLPSAKDGLAAPAGDLMSMLATAMQQVGGGAGGNPEAKARALSASGSLIPPGLETQEEKMNYLATQRETLRYLLQAYDSQAFNLSSMAGMAGLGASPPRSDRSRPPPPYPEDEPFPSSTMHKSKSELEFDAISREEAESRSQGRPSPGRQPSSGWMPWNWNANRPGARPEDDLAYGKSYGKSTGYERD